MFTVIVNSITCLILLICYVFVCYGINKKVNSKMKELNDAIETYIAKTHEYRQTIAELTEQFMNECNDTLKHIIVNVNHTDFQSDNEENKKQ